MADETTVPELATWPGIELLAVGEWPLSTGPASFTADDLAQACAAIRCPAVGQPIIKLGHHDPRFDGEPAIGWVAGMRLNDTQTKLIGDFTAMPGWLAEILPSAYPERSIEGMWDYPCQIGHVHPFVITGVALLGVTPPGVGTIGSLNDIADLYGISLADDSQPAEAARFFRLHLAPGETAMAQPAPTPARAAGLIDPARRETADAAGVVPTVDDIRRAYYDDDGTDWSEWIVEVQLTSDGPVLIVIDDSSGDLKRVPVDLSGTDPAFGQSTRVLVSYVDAPPDTGDDGDDDPKLDPAYPANAMAAVAAFPPGRQVAASWPTRAASRHGIVRAGAIGSHTTPTDDGAWDGNANQTALPTSEGTADDYRAAYAWVDPDGDPDTKAAYKFIHHMVDSDGNVGAASTVGCSAGIAVLNGGRGGSNIPDDDVQGVYTHLAKHLSDADLTPPELNAAAPQPGGGGPLIEDDPDVAGGQRHGAFDGEHAHPHADGSGGVHFHMHTHSASGRHDHSHDVVEHTDNADAATGPARPTEGSADVEFSDEQMAGIRKALGKKDGDPVTADEVITAMSRINSATAIDAAAPETPVVSDGTYLVDSSIIKEWRDRAAAGDQAVRRLHIAERDKILAAAVQQGKFPQSRLEHYERMWDKDPDGARAHVESLAAGLVPMVGPVGSNPGYDPDEPGDFAEQSAYRQLYPDDDPAGIGMRR